MSRPDSYYQSMDSTGPGNGYQPNRTRYPRTASEPHFNKVYPLPGNQLSNETVGTASGSGSSDPEGYQTENSSVDRITPMPVREPAETYGFNGFGGNPHYAPPGSGLQEQQQGGNGNRLPPQQRPQVSRKESAGKGPIKLGKANPNASPPETQRPAAGEKRKSWFGKRFSKN